MFKKRAVKLQPRKRELDTEESEVPTGSSNLPRDAGDDDDDDEKLDLQDLLAFRKLQRTRQGINVDKLNRGEVKKKRKPKVIEDDPASFGTESKKTDQDPAEDELLEEDDEEQMARKIVRSNNFTQQTNALDVDKHMMAYIEDGLKKRRGGDSEDADEGKSDPYDPHEELFRIDERYRIPKNKVKTADEDEGNVTNSVAMLTAIPEVDLGMEVRLKNIEETEKAKRAVADERRQRFINQATSNEPDHGATRFFRPHVHNRADDQALRAAKLEAQGLPAPNNDQRKYKGDRKETATDEAVMERFKKRMRK